MSDSKPLISARGVGVCYRNGKGFWMRRHGYWGIRGVDLDIFENDILGIVGKNGAGKSTLMRLLAEIYRPDEGTFSSTVKPSLLSVGTGLQTNLTGRENVFIKGAYMGFRKRQIQKRMDEIIQFSDLGEFIDKPVRTYSSGMRARLGFSIAVHFEPEFLIVDEALATGDFEFHARASAKVREMIGQCKAVVIVAHQRNVIAELCSRVIVLEKGRKRFDGEVDAALSNYFEE